MAIGWLITGFLVMARIGGALSILPVFSTPNIPAMFRVFCAISLAVVVTPVVQPGPTPATVAALIGGLTSEVLLGVMMGGVVRLVFGAIVLAGELISSQIGHGAALLYDPTTQIAQGPLATLSGLLASLVFVGTNLHLEVVQIIGHSFERVPPGQVADLIAPGGVWITLAGWVIRAGLQLAGPALALVFLVNVFMGVIGRLAPSMNAFFGLGVILTMIFGELVFTLGMPHALEAHIQMLRESLGSMTEVLRQAAGP